MYFVASASVLVSFVLNERAFAKNGEILNVYDSLSLVNVIEPLLPLPLK